jgi:hypothetical protein
MRQNGLFLNLERMISRRLKIDEPLSLTRLSSHTHNSLHTRETAANQPNPGVDPIDKVEIERRAPSR